MPLNKLNLFNNLDISEKQFLQEYWHKKPLLLSKAIDVSKLNVFPDKGQLQKLSCQESIQSRIVIKTSDSEYDVEYGPFEENDYNEINQYCWNLLVSDIDKWLPKSRNILKYFQFIRNLVFDDIMLSCGSKGGTVGPHLDQYDVFLLQVEGQREWSFNHNKTTNPQLMKGQPLQLVSDFNADIKHVLNPGDVLYLPPSVAHYGIAIDDKCITCSIGLRTPSHAELLTSFVDNLSQNISENNRFEEPEFNFHPSVGELTENDLTQISTVLVNNLKIEKNILLTWFGKYITEYRSLFHEFNDSQEVSDLINIEKLEPSSFTKSCYYKREKEAVLFVNGQQFFCSLNLAKLICDNKLITAASINILPADDKQVIETLYEDGSLISCH